MSIRQDLAYKAEELANQALSSKDPRIVQSILNHLTGSIQNGAIEPYVGVPLVNPISQHLRQVELEYQQALLGSAPQAAPTQSGAPIAQQIMAQASGLEQLPTNLPQTENEYASGGVIAFAGTDGSYVDQNESDDEEINYGGLSKQEEALMAQYLADIEARPEQGAEPQGIAATPEASNFGINPYKKGSSEGIQYTDKKHKYENQIREAARKAGIPEELFLHMMAKETGGLENPESAVSKAGARGIAQFMPATAKQYGIDPMDVNQALPAAAKMTGQLLKHYNGDQRLAAMAYNWGQGNVDKWLASGADPAKLPRETAGYIRAAEGGIMGLASGGVIAFEEGGSTAKEKEQTEKDREDFMMGLKKLGASAADVVTLPVRGVMGATNTGIRGIRAMGLDVPYIPENWFGGSSTSMTPYYDRIVRAKEQQAAQLANAQPVSAITGSKFQGDEFKLPEKKAPEVDPYAEFNKDKEASDSDIKALKDMLNERAKSAKDQKEIDAYMSLLQAGLGMMGGTSPYAFANIGKGASTGIEAALAARKNQIAEENAILSGRLGLSRAELLEKSRQNALKRQIDLDRQNAMFRSLGLQNQAKVINLKEAAAISTAEEKMAKEGAFDDLAAEYEKRYGKNWKSDALHKSNFERERLAKIRQRAAGYSADAALGIPSYNDVK